MPDQIVHPELEKYKNLLQQDIDRYAAAGLNLQKDAPTLYGNRLKTIEYYQTGAGYQNYLKDYQLQQATSQASQLGITPAQLVANPQLATDAAALTAYKTPYDTPRPPTTTTTAPEALVGTAVGGTGAPTLTPLQQQVEGAAGSLTANKEYINAVFKAWHGRDATAAELNRYTGQTVDAARSAIKAGSPLLKAPTGGSISADAIGGQAPLTVGSPIPSVAGADALTAGAATTATSLQSYIDRLTAPPTAEQTQADALTASINSLLPQTAGQAQALATEEAKQNVPGLQNQLAGINSQIQAGLAEYEQIKRQYDLTSVENRGRAVPMSKIIGNEAQIQYAKAAELNLKASDIGLLQAQALGLQGQIEAAQLAAQKAVDLKYSAIKEQIDIKMAQLALLEPTLEKQEKLQADALRLQYQEQQQAVADAKEADQMRTSFALSAMGKYLDAGISINDSYETIQQKIMSSPSYNAGGELDTQVITANGRQLLVNTQTGEVIQDFGGAYKTSGGGGSGSGGSSRTSTEKPLSTNQIEQFRRSYGWTPPFGFTQSELLQYMKDNPNATPEELEAGARSISGGTTEAPSSITLNEEYFRANFSDAQLKELSDKAGTSKWYTPASKDIDRFLEETMVKVEQARAAGYSDEEILAFLTQ